MSRACRILGNQRVNRGVEWFGVRARFQIEHSARHARVCIGGRKRERAIQNCSHLIITSLYLVSDGKLLEEKEAARVKLQSAFQIRERRVPFSAASFDETDQLGGERLVRQLFACTSELRKRAVVIAIGAVE